MSGSSSQSQSQRQRILHLSSGSAGTSGDESGILNEQILVLIFEFIKWDIHVLCRLASVCWKLRALAKRILWKGVCAHRAPRMTATLIDGESGSGRIEVGWHTIAKVLFFCCGCESTPYFRVEEPLPGHFLKESRFSKTSGRSFLVKQCRDDVLYVSDPCEHPIGSEEDDVGIYRGVFKGFFKSRTRAFLIRRKAQLMGNVRCPYCGCRVWSMTDARMVPKSASRRLGSDGGRLEYFVCVNGHLHGACLLVPLSSDDEDYGGSGDDDDDDGGDEGFQNNVFLNGCLSSGEDGPPV